MHYSSTGLKEWQAVCHALETGRQIILLRKGGIHETEGVFEIENREFVMFPTWLHQKIEWIKEPDRSLAQHCETDPEQIELRLFGRVSEILRINSRQQMDAIDDFHLYLPPLIDMRFNYKPQNPLYLLLVRAYKLPRPITIQNTAAYAGCKSWVPLDVPIAYDLSKPVLSDKQFAETASQIKSRILI